MEYVKLNDSVYFTANFYHPTSGFSYAADAAPAWLVYESGATPILNGVMTARDGIVGSYYGNFIASAANGFNSDLYYDVQVSGAIDGISGFVKIKEFVLGDLYDVNVIQVSGVNVHLNDFGGEATSATAEQVWQYANRSLTAAVAVSGIVSANIVQVSGEPVELSDIIDANIVQVSGVYVHLNDFGGGAAGATADQVWQHANRSLTAAVAVSGVANANIVQVSGLPVYPGTAYNANVTSVSGVPVSISDFKTDISSLDTDIYFAHIKYISDLTNNQDEFAVQWFKNDQPLSSGDLVNPRLSVYNTNNGSVVINGVAMQYASPNLGVVRYNSAMVLASGEPYLVETSGTIDSIMRNWKTIVGIDLL